MCLASYKLSRSSSNRVNITSNTELGNAIFLQHSLHLHKIKEHFLSDYLYNFIYILIKISSWQYILHPLHKIKVFPQLQSECYHNLPKYNMKHIPNYKLMSLTINWSNCCHTTRLKFSCVKVVQIYTVFF